MFLLPGLIVTWYVTETPIPWHHKEEMKRYLFSRTHPEDGGWGLHIEGESSVFGTCMNYVALRLLGVDAEDPRMQKARATLWKLGGALKAPHWAKFWLAVLGVLDWDVVNPVPPELWYVVLYCLEFSMVEKLIEAGCSPTGCLSIPGDGGSTCELFSYPWATFTRSDGHTLSTILRNHFVPKSLLNLTNPLPSFAIATTSHPRTTTTRRPSPYVFSSGSWSIFGFPTYGLIQ